MFKPEDLYKIILENQKYLENEYTKDCEKALKDIKEIFICPYHSIAYIEKRAIYNDFKMESMASMFPNCPICNPNGNGKANTQQTKNTQEEPKPKQEKKQAKETKPNVTPKPKAQPSQGANPIETPFLDKIMKDGEKIVQAGMQFGKDAIDFTWEQGKNVIGGALNSITGGVISSVGDKDSFAYKTTGKVVDFIPMNKFGKWFKIAKNTKALDRLNKISKVSKIFPKINAKKLPVHIQNELKKYNAHGWKGNYPGQDKRTKAGAKWWNNKDQLPKGSKENPITYQEFDLYPKVGKRGTERFVVGKNKSGKVVSVYYTDSHYGDPKSKSKHGLPDFIQIINY